MKLIMGRAFDLWSVPQLKKNFFTSPQEKEQSFPVCPDLDSIVLHFLQVFGFLKSQAGCFFVTLTTEKKLQ